MRVLSAVLLIATTVAACDRRSPVEPEPCMGPPTDSGEVWSNPRPHPDGTVWDMWFLIPPCHYRYVPDTVVVCAAKNTTRCAPWSSP